MINLKSENVDAIYHLVKKNAGLIMAASDHQIIMKDAELTEDFRRFCTLNGVSIKENYEFGQD